MKKIVCLVVMCVLMATAVQAAWYAKFDGIDGESRDDKHQNWIEILSAKHEMHDAPGSANSAELGDFDLIKVMDSTTPKLTQPVCDGKAFKTVIIELCEPNEDGLEECYMRYELEKVRITSYSFHGAADDIPTETLTLNYDKITTTFLPLVPRGEAIAATCSPPPRRG